MILSDAAGRTAGALVVLLATSCSAGGDRPATEAAPNPLKRCGQISGTVFLSSHLDKELPGVAVTFLQQGKVAFSGMTDAAGKFTTSCLPYGRYEFRLRKWLTGVDFEGIEQMVDTIPLHMRAAQVAEATGSQVINRSTDSPVFGLLSDP